MVRRILVCCLGWLCLTGPAEAVTVRDIIALSKAGLADEILVAVIDADRTIFTLDAPQILELKEAGISDAVLLKMLRTRTEFTSAPETAPEEVAPHVVVIGGSRAEGAGAAVPAYVRDVRVYYVPFPIWGTPPRAPRTPPQPFLAPEHRGFGRFINP